MPFLILFAGGSFVFCMFTWAFPLFDWDEINFAESAREMLASGNFFQVQIDFRPFWEKPPLFFWMQALSMKIFGLNAFAARFPNAICGGLSLWVLYRFGNRLRDASFGWKLSLFYAGSFLPHMYFKSGIIDPFFNLFIFLAWLNMHAFESDVNDRLRAYRPWFAGLFLALATLTKGPVALLVSGIAYLAYKLIYDRRRFPFAALLKAALSWAVLVSLWFGALVLFTSSGREIVLKFIEYQIALFRTPVAGHEQPVVYHPVIFVLGCFPLSVFAIGGMFFRSADESERITRRMMLCLFFTVMILFSIVQTKIVHYSSLTYFPAVILAGLYLEKLQKENASLPRTLRVLLMLIAVLLLLATAGAAFFPLYANAIAAKATNPFVQAALSSGKGWMPLTLLPLVTFGIFFYLAIRSHIRKMQMRFLLFSAAGMNLWLWGMCATVAPAIAGYTQDTAIEFWQSHAGEKAWLMSGGFKTYAHYFYGKVQPFDRQVPDEWSKDEALCFGEIDRPVYMLSRLDRCRSENFQKRFVHFRRTGEKNGYVFFIREPMNKPAAPDSSE